MALELDEIVAAYVVGAIRVQLGDRLALLEISEAERLHRQLGEALGAAGIIEDSITSLRELAEWISEPPPAPDSEPYVEVESEAPISRET